MISIVKYKPLTVCVSVTAMLCIVTQMFLVFFHCCAFTSPYFTHKKSPTINLCVIFENLECILDNAVSKKVTISFLIFLQRQSLIDFCASPCKSAKRTQVVFAFENVTHGQVNVLLCSGVTSQTPVFAS